MSKRKCEDLYPSTKQNCTDPLLINKNIATIPCNTSIENETIISKSNNPSMQNEMLPTNDLNTVEEISPFSNVTTELTDTELTSANYYLDSFFKDIDKQNVIAIDESSCNLTTKILKYKNDRKQEPTTSNDNILPSRVTVYEKDLKNLIFLSVEMYNEQFKVYIRQCKRNENNDIIPTKQGISMSLFTWYDFFKKINTLNFIYASSSFVANNRVLVLSSNSEIYMKMLNNTKLSNIKLKENQLEILKHAIPELNNRVINFMFSEYLPQLIIQKQRCVTKSWKSENSMMSHLMIWIEHDLTRVFKTTFQCDGCIKNEVHQLNHDCFTLSNLEKYNHLGFHVLMLTDISKIVKNFLNHVDFVTENFLNSIDVHTFCYVLFKSF